MTNWQARADIIFICPDCEHEQNEMTKNCLVCGKRRLPRATYKSRLYEIVFRMCNGTRKEKFLLLLTEKQFEKISELNSEDVYDLVQNDLWDRVVNMWSDMGCDFGAIISNVKRIDDPDAYERFGLV